MKKPMISIVVPVYNVEKYLNRCIESIINQTFNNIEIILVDDGSTDSSGNICDEYKKIDSRIKVIHKENGGLSDARNVGIENACGEWIGFVDSDDYIAENMYEQLYCLIRKYNADIAICGVKDIYEGNAIIQNKKIEEFACSGKEALELTLKGKQLAGSICNKLIHKKWLYNLKFLKDKTYEDAFITPELLLSVDTVACTTLSLYNYWHRIDSITTEEFSLKRLDVIEAYEYTKDVILERCPELIDVAQFRLYWAYFVVIDSILLSENYKHNPYYSLISRYLKREWRHIIKNNNFSSGRRIATIAFKLNVNLYRLLLQNRNNRKEILK